MPEKELPELDVPEKYQPYKDISLDRNHPPDCRKIIEIKERTTEEKVDYLIFKFALITHKLNILEEQRKKFNWCGLRNDLNSALESGTMVAFHGIYHKTINDRIKNICNALGMDLNGNESKKITNLKEQINKVKFGHQTAIIDNDNRIIDIKKVLQEVGKSLQEFLWLAEKEELLTKHIYPLRIKVRDSLKKLSGEKEDVETEGSKLDAGSTPKAQNQVRTSSQPEKPKIYPSDIKRDIGPREKEWLDSKPEIPEDLIKRIRSKTNSITVEKEDLLKIFNLATWYARDRKDIKLITDNFREKYLSEKNINGK